MDEIFLTEPNKKYKSTFENYVFSYKGDGEEYYFNKYKAALENFEGYLKVLKNYSQGIALEDDEVATSTFWLINRDEVVGITRLRHKEVEFDGHIGYDISPKFRNKGFGTLILKLVIEKCKDLELKEVIITCHINNEASRKIIEKNDGILLDTIFDKEENEWLYKYKITIKK